MGFTFTGKHQWLVFHLSSFSIYWYFKIILNHFNLIWHIYFILVICCLLYFIGLFLSFLITSLLSVGIWCFLGLLSGGTYFFANSQAGVCNNIVNFICVYIWQEHDPVRVGCFSINVCPVYRWSLHSGSLIADMLYSLLILYGYLVSISIQLIIIIICNCLTVIILSVHCWPMPSDLTATVSSTLVCRMRREATTTACSPWVCSPTSSHIQRNTNITDSHLKM